jgi:hypothetical protein
VPSEDAEIDALPAETLVARPLESTVATRVSLDAQVRARPKSSLPEASRTTAVAWVDWPTTRLADPSVTVTDATGTAMPLTVTVAVAVALPPAPAAVSV